MSKFALAVIMLCLLLGGRAMAAPNLCQPPKIYQTEAPDIFAVELVIPKNSHTYWKEVGPEGIATQFTVNAPEATIVPTPWPHPTPHMDELGFNYVYKQNPILPLKLNSPHPRQVEVTYGVCRNQCARCHFTINLADAQRPMALGQLASIDEEDFMLEVLKHNSLGVVASSGSLVVQSLPLMLLLALAGGFLLNLMPCVLPVLGLKVVAMLRERDYSPLMVRREAFATFMGIFVTYMLLATFCTLLLLSGKIAGLGLHFQNPYFVGTLAVILVLFALSLVGGLNFSILQNVYSGLLLRSQTSHFFTGVLATLLATPCGAPLVGTVAAFALTHSIVSIYLVFAMLALGMGAPYLLVLFYPRALRYLPRPGKWMLWLRYFAGLSLFFTALWLALVVVQDPAPSANSTIATPGIWHEFKPEQLPVYLAREQIVIVNFTAAWCVTCLVNKHMVWENQRLQDYLTEKQVIMLQADLTHEQPRYMEFMTRFNRNSLPTTIVFGPSAREGILLPELLRPKSLRQAVAKASNKK